MALSGWSDKLIISIDHSKIDEDLTDFPINILLSDGAGVNGKDLSRVFAEIGSDGNRKKIAVVQEDDATECFVEIERWDTANKKASLHVKVPFISSSTNTNIYLYFDSNHADNTAHVGDTGDAIAQDVWDDNYKAVYHFNQDPNAGGILTDATSNGNNLTAEASMTSGDLVDIGARKGWDLDGVDDEVSGASPLALNAYQDFTVEAIIDVDYDPGASRIQFELSRLASPYMFTQIHTGGGLLTETSNIDGVVNISGPLPTVFSNQRLIALSRKGIIGANALYDDTQPSGSFVYKDLSIESYGDETLTIGDGNKGGTSPSDGTFIDFRYSDIARSDSWKHATYRTTADELLDFESFGDADIVLPSLSADGTSAAAIIYIGDVNFPSLQVEIGTGGYADASFPALSSYGEGESIEIFIADLTFPALVSQMNAGFSAEIEFKPLVSASTGLHAFPFIGDGILPSLISSGVFGAIGSVEIASIEAIGTGLQGVVGNVNLFLPKLITEAYLNVVQTGTIDIRLKRLIGEATGTVGGAWDLIQIFPKLAVEINAVFGIIGNGNITFPAIKEAGMSSYNDIIGNGSGTININ